MFFDATVVEKDNVIKISYVRKAKIAADIQKVFKTSRLYTHMFTETGAFSLSIPSFFALELYYIIDIILERSNYIRAGKRTLRKIQEGLLKNTWLKNTTTDKPDILNFSKLSKFRFTPKDYQREFMDRYNYTVPRYNLRGMMLAAAPGTGKTFTSLAVAECRESDYIVVFCPKNAVHRVWYNSVAGKKEHGGLYNTPERCWTKDGGNLYRGERVLVFHYEALPVAFDYVNLLKDKSVTIILDESHNLNEIKSLRTLRFIEFCNRLPKTDVIFCTGTPIKAISVETIPLFKSIDPLFTDTVLTSFKKMYAGEVTATTEILSRRYNLVSHKVEKKAIELDEPINEMIDITIPNGEEYTLKRIASEMLDFTYTRIRELQQELPNATACFNKVLSQYEETITSQKEKEALKRYRVQIEVIKAAYANNMLKTVIDEMKECTAYEKNVLIPSIKTKEEKDKFIHAKTIVKYLKLKVRGECLGRILLKKRINAFKDLVRGFDFTEYIESTEKKTVVFTSYVEVIDQILQVLKVQGYEPLAVYGKHTKDLADIVEMFDKIEKYNPLVATYASLSTAVPLVMADTMVIVNPPFRQYVMDQAIARIHRLGSTTQVRIFNLNLKTGEEPNICSRTIDIMKWSEEQTKAILKIDTVEDEESTIALEAFDYTDVVTINSSENKTSFLKSWLLT